MNSDLPEEIKKIAGERRLEEVAMKVVYTNYRGETSERTIIPTRIYRGSTEFHTDEQWLMDVWDLDKNAYRTYALRDVKKWKI